jgi:hypothetical protein
MQGVESSAPRFEFVVNIRQLLAAYISFPLGEQEAVAGGDVAVEEVNLIAPRRQGRSLMPKWR